MQGPLFILQITPPNEAASKELCGLYFPDLIIKDSIDLFNCAKPHFSSISRLRKAPLKKGILVKAKTVFRITLKNFLYALQ